MKAQPEFERRFRHIRGQDSKQDSIEQQIPNGMTEREARAAGLI